MNHSSEFASQSSLTVTFFTGGLSVQVDAGVQTGLSGGMPAGRVYSGTCGNLTDYLQGDEFWL